ISSKEKYVKHYEKIIMDFIELKNTKIKNNNDSWNTPPFEKVILNKYKNEGKELLGKIRNADFLENLEKDLGEAKDTLYYFGAACLKFGKDPYKVIEEDIGINNLLEIAGLLYQGTDGDINVAKMHTPESYMAQILAIDNPDFLTIKEEL
ncbi:MAG: hypothetical protein IKC07_00550, partial [Clostridia bacterium]|nr:hypothetical protein [Clostridia bacterium]